MARRPGYGRDRGTCGGGNDRAAAEEGDPPSGDVCRDIGGGVSNSLILGLIFALGGHA